MNQEFEFAQLSAANVTTLGTVSLSVSGAYALIYPICILAMAYAYYNYFILSKIQINEQSQDKTLLLNNQEDVQRVKELFRISDIISEGAQSFLAQEYKFLSYFMILFGVLVLVCVDIVGNDNNFQAYTTVAFLLGAITSILSGYIGMRIATYSNSRTAYKAISSLAEAFQVAYRAGCVMGFFLTAAGLLVLVILIGIYRAMFKGFPDGNMADLPAMMECIAGYGLGGSTVALFGRVGGGIYTKAADVGADLVGKVENAFKEDSPKNPATIADNVGDNVGDIAGMGSDLFGSFAEATAAALAISGSAPSIYLIDNGAALFYPLIITALGLVGCFITSLFATNFMEVDQNSKIEYTLKMQLLISSVILTPFLYLAAAISLPSSFSLGANVFSQETREPYHAFICTVTGLWAGLVIGFFTEYMTSHSYQPVREVANSCQTGAATNIIFGLALGYLSTIVPVLALGVTAYVSFKLLGTFGIALAALGMLNNLAVALAIDAYGPISDNAGGIAEMAELGDDIRERTDALDAAGNTTAAVGKGFAIGSAALVSLALYGAFVTRTTEMKSQDGTQHGLTQTSIQLMNPMVFVGLLIGAMLPYAFSAMTMKSVGTAAFEMVEEVRRQLREKPGIINGTDTPDYTKCVAISTQASLKEMIKPGLLVLLTPFVIGIIFGPKFVAGLLPGALVSGVQMAISMSNTGGAWDNAKKYIESGQLVVKGVPVKKGSEEHKAAVVGDTVGDPLKDTSGPSLNILIKLMAILSLVFSSFFVKTAFLTCALAEGEPNEKGVSDC